MGNERRHRVDRSVLIVVVAAAISAAGVLWYGLESRARVREQERVIAAYEREGFEALEARQWERAELAFRRIDSLMPGSPLARIGLGMVERGIIEGKRAWMAGRMEEARAAFEAGEYERVVVVAEEVLGRFPGEAAAVDLKREAGLLAAARRKEAGISAVRVALGEKRFEEAQRVVAALLVDFPGDSSLEELRGIVAEAKQRDEDGRRRAALLYARAVERDRGVYDGEVLGWLREAMVLAPDDGRIRDLHDRMDGYGRILRVPGDFDDPNDAARIARRNDRILLGEGVWDQPLWINAPVTIEGSGPDKTVIECDAARSCAVTIGPDATGCRITGVGFRHSGPPPEQGERWSVGLVRGGGVDFAGCSFEGGGGHGLAVVARGSARAEGCRFRDNCWNGAAVIGVGSRLELRRCLLQGNFENGAESWDGASLMVVESRIHGNTRNGLHADNRGAALEVDRCRLESNHEFGIVLRSAGSGRISDSFAGANRLGGFVVHAGAAKVAFTGNSTAENGGPGLVLERGLAREAYAGTRSAGARDAAWITSWDPPVGESPPVDAPGPPRLTEPSESDEPVPRAIPVEEE